MSLAVLQDPVGGVQEIDVARGPEALPHLGAYALDGGPAEDRVDEARDGQSTVVVGDPRVCIPMVDRDAEGGLRAVVGDIRRGHGRQKRVFRRIVPIDVGHEREPDLGRKRTGHGRADETARIVPHHAEDGGRDELGSYREIGFTLPVVEVVDQYRTSGSYVLEGSVETHWIHL